jgi:hypothetical protein
VKRALVAIVAAVVLYASWSLLHPPGASQPVGSGAGPGGAIGMVDDDPVARPAAAVTTTTAPGPPWASIGEDAPTKAGYWAQLSDPARSNLGAPMAAEASRLGAALVRADATGEGRDAFYGYWGAGRAQPCCADVVVHAAGASATQYPDVVQVAVIWSAQRIGADAANEQTTVVYFTRRGLEWVAVHSWELGS